MKKLNKVIVVVTGLCMCAISTLSVSAATVAILDWHLVGEDKHIDWTGNSE